MLPGGFSVCKFSVRRVPNTPLDPGFHVCSTLELVSELPKPAQGKSELGSSKSPTGNSFQHLLFVALPPCTVKPTDT